MNLVKSVSININLHKEGIIAHSTITSVITSIKLAEKIFDIEIELNLICDNPNEETLLIAQKFEKKMTFINKYLIDKKDLGLSRNYAVDISKGNFVAFMDGDDLCSTNWLSNSIKWLNNRDPSQVESYVLHPEWNYIFGSENYLYKHISMLDDHFNINQLRLQNYWTALSFGSKQIYDDNKYQKNMIDDGFGYEDWTWNKQTISNGIIHVTVPMTCHFIRRKTNGSLLSATNKQFCLPQSTELFAYTK